MSERDRSGDHVTTVIPMEYARVNDSASRACPPAHTYRGMESSGHVVTPSDSTPKPDGNEWSPSGPVPESNGHTLYRFFNAAGDLLYIGLTNDPGRRLQKHRAEKPWWPDIARIDMEHFATREEVAAAEKAAIRAEAPLFNVIRYADQPCRRGRAAAAELPPREAVTKTIRHRPGGQTATGQLYLTYEVEHDPITDDHDHLEWQRHIAELDKAQRKWGRKFYSSVAEVRREFAQALFDDWETYYLDGDTADVCWFVAADDALIFEAVSWPHAFDGKMWTSRDFDFKTTFEDFYEILDGTPISELPVRPKDWTTYGDKGGFITEAYGWIPKPLQATVTLAELRGEQA